jgi:predicted RNA-binding protein with PIN domain
MSAMRGRNISGGEIGGLRCNLREFLCDPPGVRWLVDASNVIGSVPDGWWKDREGATRRLLEALREHARRSGDELVVVLDAGPAELEGSEGGVEVVRAPRRGRDAADEEIVRRLGEDPRPEEVHVATSDRALAEQVRALGAEVEGARAFRRRVGA